MKASSSVLTFIRESSKLLLNWYMLTIHNETDYAFLMLSKLIVEKDFIPLSAINRVLRLPERFLARVASRLVKGGILISQEGKIGGYKLAKRFLKMNLYDFLKLFEGDLEMVKCLDKTYQCPWETICIHKSYLRNKLNHVLVRELKKIPLKAVLC